MNDIFATITPISLGAFMIAVPAVLYFIFQELRAIRKMLQARQAYDWDEIWCRWEEFNKPKKRPNVDPFSGYEQATKQCSQHTD